MSPPPPQHDGGDLINRVGRIESTIADLADQVGEAVAEQRAVNATVTSLASTVHEQSSQIRAITTRMSEPRQMNWNAIIGGVVLLGSFILLYTGPIHSRTERLESREDRRQERELVRARESGEVAERLRWLESTVKP